MAELMAQQLLAAGSGQFSRCKSNVTAHCHSVRPGLRHGLALVELYAGKIRAECTLHFGLYGGGKIDRRPELLLGRHRAPLQVGQGRPLRRRNSGAVVFLCLWAGSVCLIHVQPPYDMIYWLNRVSVPYADLFRIAFPMNYTRISFLIQGIWHERQFLGKNSKKGAVPPTGKSAAFRYTKADE